MARLVSQVFKHSLKPFSCAQGSKIGNCRCKFAGFTHVRSIVTTSVFRAEKWFTEKHEWVEIDGKIGTVGISDYAQDALGDVVYAQLPDVGTEIKQDEEVGALESVKAASEVISPVSGKVVEKNDAVENKPGLINTSCYTEGWLFKVELSLPDEITKLMNEKSYEEFLKSDPH
ncbi:glycine cleavage system H protein, mitochondrial [Fopius arisanus]|uniref:Glycine cleavage system H protein n=1 Tax=Fopius arisanus TaxID=64838 RepID=A0A9R1TS56_9HYME|nr:PREDICTED: glycine cleavage system H protein, mitochondrial [Fopius arisanus]